MQVLECQPVHNCWAGQFIRAIEAAGVPIVDELAESKVNHRAVAPWVAGLRDIINERLIQCPELGDESLQDEQPIGPHTRQLAIELGEWYRQRILTV